VKSILESVRDNSVTIVKSANAVGKTHASARAGVWFYKSFPNSQVYTAAAPPENNLKNLLWGELGSIIESHPLIFAEDTIRSLFIGRSAQSFLTGVTIPSSGTKSQREAKFSGKHSPYLLFIIDEGDAVPDEVYQGIESCMYGGHARLLIMFNPRSRMGAVYRMQRDRKANIIKLSAFDHPNVQLGHDIIQGAVTRETVVRRINEWCRPLSMSETPDSDCFILPDYLERATATSSGGTEYPPLKPGYHKIMEPSFSYMVLGEYPRQDTTQLISRQWIDQARLRWDKYVLANGEKAPINASATVGLDVGEYDADSNVLCFRYGAYVERLKCWNGVDVISTAEITKAECENRKVSAINTDATGIGAGVAPYLQRKNCHAVPVKVASSPSTKSDLGEFGILRDQLWWACREWLRTDNQAMLPPDDLLIEELLTPTYNINDGKVRIMKKSTIRELIHRSCDRADALCLTFFKDPSVSFVEYFSAHNQTRSEEQQELIELFWPHLA